MPRHEKCRGFWKWRKKEAAGIKTFLYGVLPYIFRKSGVPMTLGSEPVYGFFYVKKGLAGISVFLCGLMRGIFRKKWCFWEFRGWRNAGDFENLRKESSRYISFFIWRFTLYFPKKWCFWEFWDWRNAGDFDKIAKRSCRYMGFSTLFFRAYSQRFWKRDNDLIRFLKKRSK